MTELSRRRTGVRRFWLAGLLSFVTPGLGHLYNGMPLHASLAFLAVYAFVLLWVLVGNATFPRLVFGMVLGVSIYLAIALHAAIHIRRYPATTVRWYSRWFMLVLVFVVASEVVPALNSLVVPRVRYRSYTIPIASMEPTLRAGDRFSVDAWAYRDHAPRRGDVVVVRVSHLDAEYVKRVVGEPGDRIRIIDQQVYVDGTPLEEPYKRHTAPSGAYADPFRDNFPPLQRLDIGIRETGFDPLWYEDHLIDGDILVPDQVPCAWGQSGLQLGQSVRGAHRCGFDPREGAVRLLVGRSLAGGDSRGVTVTSQ